jgi:flagellar export protein FliJ
VSRLPRLGAVARVRSVRELDSRLGLVEALAEERAARCRAEDLRRQLSAVSAFGAGALADFAGRQRRVTALAEALVAARAALEDAHLLAEAARDRWRTDRSRLAAVESLIERREQERRHELRRREDRQLDAAAEDVWRRGAGAVGS